MKYQDFVLQVGPASGGQLRVRVARSPAGEGENLSPWPSWLTSLMLPETLADLAADLAAGRGPGQRDVVRRNPAPRAGPEIGRQLYELLFAGLPGRLFERSLGTSRGKRGEGLRLRLQLDLEAAAGLGSVPWELLHRAETDTFLALDRHTPIVRHLEVAQPISPLPPPAMLEVAGVAAAPGELEALDLEAEKHELSGVRGKRKWRLRFLAQPTVDELRRVLVEQRVHVLHFMGHGDFDHQLGQGVLLFEDGRGGCLPLTGQALAAKVAGVPSLRLVVLNACQSAAGAAADPYGGVAAALVRGGIAAVVAMQQPIADVAAIAFSKAFYRRLAAGAEVEEALTEGRQAIHTLSPGSGAFSIPVLFSRTSEPLFVPLEALAARRRRLAAVAAAASLLLPLSLPPVRVGIGSIFRGETVYTFEVDKALATGVDGLNGRLAAVEILADGKIRLHFEFDNQSEKDRTLGFDLRQTYLADENGNAYPVKASSSPVKNSDADLIETVKAGDSRSYWLEFQAPQDEARRLHVELATSKRSEASFVPFQVSLPSYPKELSQPSAKAARLPETEAEALEIVVDDGRKDVASEVRQLEVGKEGMRLSFDMWNHGTQALAADFDPARIELRDERGNRLKPRRIGYFDQGVVRDLTADTKLRRAVRTRLFLEFPPPTSPSQNWRLQLATRPDSEFSFGETLVKVADKIFERVRETFKEFDQMAQPKLEVRPRVDPPPPPPVEAPSAAEPEPLPAPVVPEQELDMGGGGQEITATNPDVRAQLSNVYRLSNQRLRFVVQLGNAGGAQIVVALRISSTKLSDDQGRTFKVLDSTFGDAGPGGIDEGRFTLAPGSQRELFFDFSGRVQGTENFTFYLGSADPDLRFRPIGTTLPPE
jgi:hypothetical protein